VALEPIRDGPRQRVRHDGPGCPRVVCVLQAGELLLPCRIGAQAPRRRLGTGPRAVGVPAFGAGRAPACARRGLGTRAQATRGDAIRHRRHASTVVHVVEPHAAEALAAPRHGLSPRARGGGMVCGRLDDRACDVAQPLVVRGAQGQGACEARGHHGSGTAVGDALAVGFGGARLAELGHGILPRGMVARGQPCSACAQHVGAAPSQGAGRTHRRGRDRGLRPQASPEEPGPLVRIARVMFGRAAGEGFQRAGVPEDAGQARRGAEGSEPVPGAEACNGHTQTGPRGRNRFEQWCRSGLHLAVEHDGSVVAHQTDGQTAGVQVDATGKGVLLGVEAPEVSFLCSTWLFSLGQHTTGVC
jgi:hypothetical protein